MALHGKLQLQNVRGMVIDEADMCLTSPSLAEAMGALLRRMADARAASNVPPPQTLLAGK